MVIGLAMVLSAGTAFADMADDSGDYEVTLGNICTIDASGATTNFGIHPLGAADLMGVPAGSISVQCTTGLNYEVGAGGGSNYGMSGYWIGTPTMYDGGADYVAYVLLESGNPLGDGGLDAVDPTYSVTNPSFPGFAATGTGAPQVYTLTADVGISAPPTAGTYTDTMTFTVVW